MATVCRSCNLPFGSRRGQRFDICLPCFKMDQGWKLNKADEAHQATMVALHHATEAHRSTYAELTKQRDEVLRLLMETDRLRHLLNQRHPQPPALGDAPWRDLLRLVHPDRHPEGLAETANRVTQWVLSQRRAR